MTGQARHYQLTSDILELGVIPELGGLVSGTRFRRASGRWCEPLSSHWEDAKVEPGSFGSVMPVWPGVNRLRDGVISDWQGSPFDCNALEGERLEHLLHYHRWVEMRVSETWPQGISLVAEKNRDISNFSWPGANYRVTVTYEIVAPEAANLNLGGARIGDREPRVVYSSALDMSMKLELLEDGETPLEGLFHPFFQTKIGNAKKPMGQFNATGYVPLDASCLPLNHGKVEPLPPELDYRVLREMSGPLDHTTSGWDGNALAVWPEAQVAVKLVDMRGNCPYLQAWYMPEQFEVWAFEAQPNHGDALNCPAARVNIARRAGDKFEIRNRIVFLALE